MNSRLNLPLRIAFWPKALAELGKTGQASKETEIAEKFPPEKPEVDREVATFYAGSMPSGETLIKPEPNANRSAEFDQVGAPGKGVPAEAERERALFAQFSAAEEQAKSPQEGNPAGVAPFERKRSACSEPKAVPEARRI